MNKQGAAHPAAACCNQVLGFGASILSSLDHQELDEFVGFKSLAEARVTCDLRRDGNSLTANFLPKIDTGAVRFSNNLTRLLMQTAWAGEGKTVRVRIDRKRVACSVDGQEIGRGHDLFALCERLVRHLRQADMDPEGATEAIQKLPTASDLSHVVTENSRLHLFMLANQGYWHDMAGQRVRLLPTGMDPPASGPRDLWMRTNIDLSKPFGRLQAEAIVRFGQQIVSRVEEMQIRQLQEAMMTRTSRRQTAD